MITGKERDVYGIPYVIHENGPMPRPNDFIMKDISEWRTAVNIPTIEGYDWESAAQKDCAVIDKNKAVAVLNDGPFMALVNSMSFEALTAFQDKLLENVLKYYHPIDAVIIADDVATARDLFISPRTYREMILPFHRKRADIAKKYNVHLEMHCCGKCESIVEDWVNMGVRSWQPAQPVNDLAAIQNNTGSNSP
jgi:hypothetical protein